MTLSSDISTTSTALSNIKQAIIDKGVTPSGNITTYAQAISSIPSGGATDYVVLNFGETAATDDLTITVNNVSVGNGVYGIYHFKMLLPVGVEVGFSTSDSGSDALELYVNSSLVRSGSNFTYTFQSNSTVKLEFNLGCCIPYYTEVNYFNGTTKVAEDVKIGDKLLGYDTTDKELKEVEVTNIIKKIRKDLVKVKTQNYEIEITPDHPILTDKGWAVYDTNYSNYQGVDKIKLDSSLKLLTKENNYEQIISVTLDELNEPIDVYTFNTTDGIDTYLAKGLILHNAPCVEN